MADATPKPAPRRSIAKRFALMAAVLASAILIYGGAEVTRTVHLMIESEKNLQSTLYTFAIVEQFVKTERRWPRSWRELERVVMPVEPGQREFAVPYQMSMTEVQQRVIVDFEAGIDVMISDSSQNFTAIRPNGASYPYDKGQIAALLAELRAIVGERTPGL